MLLCIRFGGLAFFELGSELADFLVEGRDFLATGFAALLFVFLELVDGRMQGRFGGVVAAKLHFGFGQFKIVGSLRKRHVDFVVFQQHGGRLEQGQCPIGLLGIVLAKRLTGLA